MLAKLYYPPHLHLLSNDAFLLDYTANQRLYLIRSKLEKSLIIASKDEKYKSQSHERNCFDESEQPFGQRHKSHQELKCFVVLSFFEGHLNFLFQFQQINLLAEFFPYRGEFW